MVQAAWRRALCAPAAVLKRNEEALSLDPKVGIKRMAEQPRKLLSIPHPARLILAADASTSQHSPPMSTEFGA
jgi:hypothetical protein